MLAFFIWIFGLTINYLNSGSSRISIKKHLKILRVKHFKERFHFAFLIRALSTVETSLLEVTFLIITSYLSYFAFRNLLFFMFYSAA